MKIQIKNKTREYDGFLKLEKATLQFEKFSGDMSSEVSREAVHRGDSAAVLLYDPARRLVLFAKQFRYPVYTAEPENAWLLELVAGSVEPGEEPTETLVREIAEESGLTIDLQEVQYIGRFFPSPGGLSERIFLYSAAVDLSAVKSQGGAVAELEDIKLIVMSYEDAFAKLENDDIPDAKTMIGLQWLMLLASF